MKSGIIESPEHKRPSRKLEGKQMKAVVDRIENQIAVVLIGEEEIKVDILLVLLPEGTRESSHLNISFELDEAGEASKGRG